MRWFAEITNHSRDFVEEVVSSRFWHEEKARERNVDTLNKTHYESGIWSVIESRVTTTATATAKFRLDFFSSNVRVIAF